MHRKSKMTGLFGMSVLLLLPQLALSGGGSLYRVTISNLTAGQPFTPPVLATHNKKTGIFTVGEETSYELQQIAENGNNGPLVNLLSSDDNVRAVVSRMTPIVPANNPVGAPFGSSETFEIWAGGKANYISIVSMLICTNDGFMGIDSVRLPSKKRTVFAAAYDARTEENTEVYANMVPPCQALIEGINPPVGGTGMSDDALFEEGVVIPHAGINGGADLQSQLHGWGDPVAKIVIERVRHNDHDDDSDSDSD